MQLTLGQYDKESNLLFIKTLDVEEKPKTYQCPGWSFRKDEEEIVRYIKGYGGGDPYLSVYTLTKEKPAERIQFLIMDELEKNIKQIPLRTNCNGEWFYTIQSIKQYLDTVDLSGTDIKKEDFVTDEKAGQIMLMLGTKFETASYLDLKNIVAEMVEDLKKENEEELDL